jgi:hypothetical protein
MNNSIVWIVLVIVVVIGGGWLFFSQSGENLRTEEAQQTTDESGTVTKDPETADNKPGAEASRENIGSQGSENGTSGTSRD